jgi:hypothetical protein
MHPSHSLTRRLEQLSVAAATSPPLQLPTLTTLQHRTSSLLTSRPAFIMKLTAVLVAAASVATTVSASWVPGQISIKEEYKVPGDNPLYFCDDPKDNILEIENVDLSPNPPQPYVCHATSSHDSGA